MNKTGIVGIVIFLLISSMCIGALAYLLGSFYFPSPIKQTSAEMQAVKYTTVIIDAGHGGEDGGASSAAGLVEKDVNLEIAKILADMLRASGVKVIMTRDEDKLLYDRNTDYQGRKKKLDMAARLGIMQKADNAIFVSIHMNSYTSERYSGLQVWYSSNHADSETLAELIQLNNQKLLQPDNTRRIKNAESSIFLLKEAPCPAVLVECGFLSNPSEAAKFETREYRQAVALMLCTSILEFLYTE